MDRVKLADLLDDRIFMRELARDQANKRADSLMRWLEMHKERSFADMARKRMLKSAGVIK